MGWSLLGDGCMIRAFTALAKAGAPTPSSYSIGISEALINTALRSLAAIIGIVAYNFFVTRWTFHVHDR
jgi:biopolymer transport protein ExbB/TolQ